MKELKKVEMEEIARFNQAGSFDFERQPTRLSSTIVSFLDLFIEWLFLSDFVFDLSLLADFGIFRSVEMSPDIRLGS